MWHFVLLLCYAVLLLYYCALSLLCHFFVIVLLLRCHCCVIVLLQYRLGRRASDENYLQQLHKRWGEGGGGGGGGGMARLRKNGNGNGSVDAAYGASMDCYRKPRFASPCFEVLHYGGSGQCV